MSFFGLTRLGHERPFFSNTDGAYALNIFDDEEFGAAFDAGAGGSPTAASAALRDILERLYRGPFVPASILRGLGDALGGGGDSFSKDDFMQACRKLKREAEEREAGAGANEAREYGSYHKLKADSRKNARLKFGPSEKYVHPMTCNQDLGWRAEEGKDVNTVRRPKKSCAETKYADAMVKAGVYF